MSDLDHGIDCPRAKSWMTPCIARDGRSALADDRRCVGCDEAPHPLLDDLLTRLGDTERMGSPTPEQEADMLTALVRLYVTGKDPRG